MHRKREKFDIDFHEMNTTITIDEYMTEYKPICL